MAKIYLFDWGDTLMVNPAHMKGKMCNWEHVAVIETLGVDASEVTMVGDILHRDIEPAVEAGLNAIWYTPDASLAEVSGDYQQIQHLSELCDL
ncbi:HAD hydrolase-like protein [Moritella sp.]|uniref:HAD family hydrolase n=1 Tax=Moritella sp. TaxID=78556 RepID=UPI001DE69AAF|nr:HAD hydrolase-like protein [Moritella sp.]MCJ8351318.1 HAD hydrolase-like protein [Moritella sp.]NQZ42370.1 HAD hydrolase-like protein [Moritella sp.]